MKILIIIFSIILISAYCENLYPIIGVYDQPSEYADYPPEKYSYIAASYVKYLESSGSRVVRIPYYETEKYYDWIFS